MSLPQYSAIAIANFAALVSHSKMVVGLNLVVGFDVSLWTFLLVHLCPYTCILGSSVILNLPYLWL